MIHEEKLLFMLKIENLWKVEKRFLTKREKSALIAALEERDYLFSWVKGSMDFGGSFLALHISGQK